MSGENIVSFVIGFLFSFYLCVTFIYLKKVIPLRSEISYLKDLLRSIKIYFEYCSKDDIDTMIDSFVKRIDEALK